MSKIFFDNPLMLGFDTMVRHAEKKSRCSDSYPPYNIEQIADNIIIKLALAGFYEKELSIIQEGNQLIIAGAKQEEDTIEETLYLHKGISLKKFQKIFFLAEGVEPKQSYLDNGILHINLKQVTLEPITKIINIGKKE